MKQNLIRRLENLEGCLLPFVEEPLRIIVEFARPDESGNGKTIEVIPASPSNAFRRESRNPWRRRAS